MVNMSNYEEYMLLYADKELSKAEEQELLAFVAAYPKLQKELKAYTATQLQPDSGLVFADKDSLLKKGSGGRTMWLGGWKTYAAVASVILFVVLFNILINGDTESTHTPIAKNDTITAPVNTRSTETIAKKEEPVEDKLQSTNPVDAVAVKTSKPQPTENNTHKLPVNTTVGKEEETIDALPATPATLVAVQTTQQKMNEVPLPNVTIAEHATNDHKPQVNIPGINESKQLLNGLAGTVSEKLADAKQIRNDIKNTDLVVKVGKKELFTVRL